MYPRRTHRQLGIAPGRVHPQHCRIVPVRKVKGHKHRRGYHRDHRSNRWRRRILRHRRRWVPRRLRQIRVRQIRLVSTLVDIRHTERREQSGRQQRESVSHRPVGIQRRMAGHAQPRMILYSARPPAPLVAGRNVGVLALHQSWATACRPSVCGSGRRRARPGTLGAGWARFSVCTPDEWANHWS